MTSAARWKKRRFLIAFCLAASVRASEGRRCRGLKVLPGRRLRCHRRSLGIHHHHEHVVRNAHKIRVILTPKSDHSLDALVPAEKQKLLDAVVVGANREPVGKRQVLDATVVGANRETDIALLKIEASGLPVIPLNPAGRGPPPGTNCARCRQPRGSRQYDDDRNCQRGRPPAAAGRSPPGLAPVPLGPLGNGSAGDATASCSKGP